MAEKKPKKKKVIQSFGKRKSSVARASIEAGKGRVMINSCPLELWGTEFLRMRLKEPLLLAGEKASEYDFIVTVYGGGLSSQSEAIRMSIARCFVKVEKDLKATFLDYDRHLLVFDPRRNETHHAGGASQRGSRRHKQRSKR